MKKTSTPQPPECLVDEALLEWHRICDELESVGNLHTADRALMVLHCQTWQVNQSVAKHVAQHGPICRFNNQVIGQSPYYKTQQETGRALAKMLEQLGLSPASRGFKQAESIEAGEIEF